MTVSLLHLVMALLTALAATIVAVLGSAVIAAFVCAPYALTFHRLRLAENTDRLTTQEPAHG